MPETFVRGGRKYTVYDLSDTLSNRTSAFEPNRHEIEYLDSRRMAVSSREEFGLGPEYWPSGHAMNVERVALSTHSGTHVDAPHHYGPRADGGRALTIDEVPLSWCMGDGVCLDFRHKPTGAGIDRADVEAELRRIGYTVKPFDIVLVMTGTSRHFGTPGYERLHAGLRRDATEWLVDQGVRLIGIDAWGLDRPMDVMAEEARRGNLAQLWESHLLGREKPYCQIERLAHLEELPRPFGFRVLALPVKVEAASAAWTRVVAIYDEPA